MAVQVPLHAIVTAWSATAHLTWTLMRSLPLTVTASYTGDKHDSLQLVVKLVLHAICSFMPLYPTYGTYSVAKVYSHRGAAVVAD